MTTSEVKAKDFLSQERITVAGVSGTGQGAANLVYCKPRDKCMRWVLGIMGRLPEEGGQDE